MNLLSRLRLRGNRRAWERLGRADPLWAVLSDPAKSGRRWDEAAFFATGEAEIERSLERLRGIGLEARSGTALDFGCGVGRLSRALAGRFASVIGVDISYSMVNEARRRNAGFTNIQFLVSPGPSIDPIDTSSVDFIYSRLVLQHIPPNVAEGYIREFVRVLAPGGVAMFSAPDRDPRNQFGGLRPILRALRELLPGQRHMSVYHLSRERVERAVAHSGGMVAAALDDPTPPGWTGFLYVVTKSTPT